MLATLTIRYPRISIRPAMDAGLRAMILSVGEIEAPDRRQSARVGSCCGPAHKRESKAGFTAAGGAGVEDAA